jgi:hypothetical protein
MYGRAANIIVAGIFQNVNEAYLLFLPAMNRAIPMITVGTQYINENSPSLETSGVKASP